MRRPWLCTSEQEVQRYFDLDRDMDVARRLVVAVVILPALVTASSFGRVALTMAASPRS